MRLPRISSMRYKRQEVSLKKRPNRRSPCYSHLMIMVNVPNLFLASFFSILPCHIYMTTLLQLGVLTPAEVQLQFLSRSLSIMIEAAHALIEKQGPHLTPNDTVSPY